MEKEKSNEALARILDDPSFPFVSIGSTNASGAGAASVKHSSGVSRRDEPVNVRVFLHEYLYKVPQSAPCKHDKYLFADR